MIGQTISHYRVTEKLGSGAMGVVYAAMDLRLDRVVALKFLPASLETDEDRKRRFLQEAKTASALDHPNICTIHQIDQTDDGQMFIVMGCYRGETLRDKITRGKLPIAEALDFAIQTAQGLAKAAQAGIVHRDIKPANIMVTTDRTVKILDFGLARLVEETKITVPGSVMGTPAYMSPEQANGGTTNHRSDIWALGVLVHEMLSGRLPFKGESSLAILYSLLNEDPPPLIGLPDGISDALNRIVSRALVKEPEGRYQLVDEMLVDLQAVARQLEGGETMIVTNLEPAPQKKPSGRRYAAVGVLAFAVIVAALILSQRLSNSSVAEPTAAQAQPEATQSASTPAEDATEAPAVSEQPAPPTSQRREAQAVAESAPQPAVRTAVRTAESPAASASEEPPPPVATAVPQAPAVIRPPIAIAPEPAPVPRAAPVQAARQPDELADWARIRNSSDITDLQGFLRRYPDGMLRVEALNRLETLKWEAAQATDDPEAAAAYLQEYPRGRYAGAARALVARVGTQARDVEAIREAVRNFAAAYERRDAKVLAALWPSLTSDQLSSISDSFRDARSIRYQLTPASEPEISGGSATVRYRRSLQFEFTGRPPQPVQDDVTFSLRKQGASWVIDQVATAR